MGYPCFNPVRRDYCFSTQQSVRTKNPIERFQSRSSGLLFFYDGIVTGKMTRLRPVGFNPVRRDYCFSTLSSIRGFRRRLSVPVSIPFVGIIAFLREIDPDLAQTVRGFNPVRRDYCFSTTFTVGRTLHFCMFQSRSSGLLFFYPNIWGYRHRLITHDTDLTPICNLL